jgi:hypothetical protein
VGNELKYILDANVFIEAYKRYYAFDLCPGFWRSIEHYGAQCLLASIDRVRDELQEGDNLDTWKSQAPEPLFLPTDTEETLAAYVEIIQWAQKQTRLNDGAKTEFAQGVDAWLIAFAKANNLTMITHEQPAPESKKDIKIPDVCKAFNIECKNTFDMLRDLQISYHWNAPQNS